VTQNKKINVHRQHDATDTTSQGQESPKINQLNRSGAQESSSSSSSTINQLNRKGQATEVPVEEFRNVNDFATGSKDAKKDFSQHRAKSGFDDYSFKNLARGNADDRPERNAYNHDDFVNKDQSVFSNARGGTETREKTNLSRTAVIQKSHPELEKNSVKTESKTYNYDRPVEQEMREAANPQTNSTSGIFNSWGGFERNYILPINPNYRKIGHAGFTTAAFLAALKMNKGMVPALKVAGVAGLIGGLVINPELFNPLLSKPMYLNNSS